MPHSDDMRDDCLEQVAAHIGYRPWREFCAIKDKLAAAERERDAARAKLAVLVDAAERIGYLTGQPGPDLPIR